MALFTTVPSALDYYLKLGLSCLYFLPLQLSSPSRESHKLNFRFHAKLAERKSKTLGRHHLVSKTKNEGFRYHWVWFPIKSARAGWLSKWCQPSKYSKESNKRWIIFFSDRINLECESGINIFQLASTILKICDTHLCAVLGHLTILPFLVSPPLRPLFF